MDRAIMIGLTSFVITASILAVPGVAFANEHGQRGEPMTRSQLETRIAERFAAIDADGNGAISREEAEAQREAHRTTRMGRRFDRMDANDDGEISAAERDAALQARRERRAERLAARQERHEAAWNAADSDGNSTLNRDELTAMTETRHTRHRQHMGQGEAQGRRNHRGGRHSDRFERLDSNGDGSLTLAELSEHRLAMFDRADANSDGTVTREEHRAARQARRTERQQHRTN